MQSSLEGDVKFARHSREQAHHESIRLYVSHPALIFCWHLRLGFYREIDAARMREYAKFFYRTYLLPHLELQIDRMSLCESMPPEVLRKMYRSHRALHRLFSQEQIDKRVLGRIEEKVEAHVRIEKLLMNSDASHFLGMTSLTQRQKHDLWFDQELAARLNIWPDRYWESE